jgi:Ca2+-binding RTX toxin-like protein
VDGDTVGLAGKSSNTTLVPASSIVCSGSGASRMVTITPAARNSGSTTITLSASDGKGGTAALTFSVVVGTDKAETINAANGTNLVLGLGGKDNINGGNGIDVLCGRAGTDALSGGNGDNTLDGGDDNGMLQGGNGNDTLTEERAPTRSAVGLAPTHLPTSPPAKATPRIAQSHDAADMPSTGVAAAVTGMPKE